MAHRREVLARAADWMSERARFHEQIHITEENFDGCALMLSEVVIRALF
jgi:hypothetical protein